MFEIETLYRVMISFEVTDSLGDAQNEKVNTKAYEICKAHKVDMAVSFDGNGACGPYVVIESDNKKKLKKAANAIISYIKRFKQWEIS